MIQRRKSQEKRKQRLKPMTMIRIRATSAVQKDPNDLIKRYMHIGSTRSILTIAVYTYRPVIYLKHI